MVVAAQLFETEFYHVCLAPEALWSPERGDMKNRPFSPRYFDTGKEFQKPDFEMEA